jgi:hypothetical protein
MPSDKAMDGPWDSGDGTKPADKRCTPFEGHPASDSNALDGTSWLRGAIDGQARTKGRPNIALRLMTGEIDDALKVIYGLRR